MCDLRPTAANRIHCDLELAGVLMVHEGEQWVLAAEAQAVEVEVKVNAQEVE